ncbi:MAG: hypothetical protein ACKVQS_04345 [Fimbriimonadaceae bacterium]
MELVGELDEDKIACARTLARSDRERDWVDKAKLWFSTDYFVRRDDPAFPAMVDANALRRQIPVVEQARLNLLQNYSTVSCGKLYGKGF